MLHLLLVDAHHLHNFVLNTHAAHNHATVRIESGKLTKIIECDANSHLYQMKKTDLLEC